MFLFACLLLLCNVVWYVCLLVFPVLFDYADCLSVPSCTLTLKGNGKKISIRLKGSLVSQCTLCTTHVSWYESSCIVHVNGIDIKRF